MLAVRNLVLPIALLGLYTAHGYLNTYFEFDPQYRKAWLISFVIVGSSLVYAWYYYDSEVHGFRRRKWLNIAVVGLAIFAIPYYVFQSRGKGQRRKAMLYLSGYFLITFACVGIGKYLAAAEQIRQDFRSHHPCPSTGKTHGPCPGYVIDERDGPDAAPYMQWEMKEEATRKDRRE